MSKWDREMQRRFDAMDSVDPEIEISAMASRDAVIVEITYDNGLDEPFVITESAIRSPEDKFDAEVGINLALGRAFTQLGNKFLKRGLGRMKHNDQMRELKEDTTWQLEQHLKYQRYLAKQKQDEIDAKRNYCWIDPAVFDQSTVQRTPTISDNTKLS